MITFLIGTVDSTTADAACLNVQGVGYEVFCPTGTLAKCLAGQQVKLVIHHHITESNQALYGFWDEAERKLFRLLIAISGVGPKAGLSILSTLSPAQLADAVATQSGKMVAKANGVGPKLGERIVVELKTKLGSLPMASATAVAGSVVGGISADVLSALMNMGFKEQEAQTAVSATLKSLPEAPFDALLKGSLQALR